MLELSVRSELEPIAEKVKTGERLSREDGIVLMRTSDLLGLGALADQVRRRKVGDYVYFINNAHINYSNVCTSLCRLCAFGKAEGDQGAYLMSLDEIEERATGFAAYGITELHIVGGLHPRLPLSYYEEMLRRSAAALPGVHIQAFTAVEVDHFARISGNTPEEVLLRLKEAGLGSLPGGGAEIFSARVRDQICGNKISGERWLEISAMAHRLGLRTNATMLYGHVETPEERVDHLLKLRALQDETGGFQTFIPLAFHPTNTRLEELPATSGYDDLRVPAAARLLLDNFDHIKAFWIMIGLKMAQISLSFGVDDLDGTVREERITHAAGASTGQYTPPEEFIQMIREAGRVPVERDTLYNIVRMDF